jgi:hypothetical protein
VRVETRKPSPVSRLAALATLSRKRERGFQGCQFPSEISIPRLVAGRAISSSYQRLTFG